MVLIAALPSASNVSLLAERFGADNGRIARIILVTTAAAFLTFSARYLCSSDWSRGHGPWGHWLLPICIDSIN
jgi:hypothetical protein